MNTCTRLAAAMVMGGAMVLGVSACGRETPDKTAADVEQARVEADQKVAKAREDAAHSTVGAQKDVVKANQELAHENAEARQQVTNAEADANYKVAVEKCEAYTGSARSECKKQADADRDANKAIAKSNELAADPKK